MICSQVNLLKQSAMKLCEENFVEVARLFLYLFSLSLFFSSLLITDLNTNAINSTCKRRVDMLEIARSSAGGGSGGGDGVHLRRLEVDEWIRTKSVPGRVTQKSKIISNVTILVLICTSCCLL